MLGISTGVDHFVEDSSVEESMEEESMEQRHGAQLQKPNKEFIRVRVNNLD